MKFDAKGLIAALQADLQNAPQILEATKELLAKLEAGETKVLPFLQEFFPQIAQLGPPGIAAAKKLLDFLSAWSPTALPWILSGLSWIVRLVPMPAAMMTATASDPNKVTFDL